MKNSQPETFDGFFKYCLGAECPQPCCGQDRSDIYLRSDEIDDVQKIAHEVGDGRTDINPIIIKRLGLIMEECFQNGKCLLEDRRPSVCKIYPLSVESDQYASNSNLVDKFDKGDDVTVGLGKGSPCPQQHLLKKDPKFIADVARWARDIMKCRVKIAPELQSEELGQML